jgi:hypothetical protein
MHFGKNFTCNRKRFAYVFSSFVLPLPSPGHFYEQDEYEMAALEKNEAPLCRMQLDGQGEVAAPVDGAPIAFFSSFTIGGDK